MAHDFYLKFVKVDPELNFPNYHRNYCRKSVINLMPEIATQLYLKSFEPEQLNTLTETANSIFR